MEFPFWVQHSWVVVGRGNILPRVPPPPLRWPWYVQLLEDLRQGSDLHATRDSQKAVIAPAGLLGSLGGIEGEMQCLNCCCPWEATCKCTPTHPEGERFGTKYIIWATTVKERTSGWAALGERTDPILLPCRFSCTESRKFCAFPSLLGWEGRNTPVAPALQNPSLNPTASVESVTQFWNTFQDITFINIKTILDVLAVLLSSFIL